MEYVKEGCNTPVKNACKSTNMLQLLKFSFRFYRILHEYRTYRSYKSVSRLSSFFSPFIVVSVRLFLVFSSRV
jgi:hypothetical protein